MSEGQSSNMSQLTINYMNGILSYNPAHGFASMMEYMMNDYATNMKRYKEVVATTDAKGEKNTESCEP